MLDKVINFNHSDSITQGNSFMSSTGQKIYTLTALNKALERKITNDFGDQTFWVTAEITKIDNKGGHYFFELADAQNNATTALMSAFMWATHARMVKAKLGEQFESILKRGNRVLFSVKIEFHPLYGLKLAILDIDPSYSYGEIERRKIETIKRLKKEGLLDKQKTLYFPTLSKRIAVVGSPKTSGIGDFKEELFNNPNYTQFKVKNFWTAVQGDQAKPQLIQALRNAAMYDVDVIVLIRGGGSKMDLDVFNDYDLCKTISALNIPVLTGIGHQTDQVVADLVAHQYFITPTAVAKHLHTQIGNFSHILNQYNITIQKRILEALSGAKDEFNYLSKYFVHYSQSVVKEKSRELENISTSIERKSTYIVHLAKSNLGDKRYEIFNEIKQFLRFIYHELDLTLNTSYHQALQLVNQHKSTSVDALKNRLEIAVLYLLEKEKLQLKNQEELLYLLNPEKILQAGYTISTVNEKDLNQLDQTIIGKELKTLASNFLVSSTITTVEKIDYGKK